MEFMSTIVALAVLSFGGVLVVAGMRDRLAPAGDVGEYLSSLDG